MTPKELEVFKEKAKQLQLLETTKGLLEANVVKLRATTTAEAAGIRIKIEVSNISHNGATLSQYVYLSDSMIEQLHRFLIKQSNEELFRIEDQIAQL